MIAAGSHDGLIHILDIQDGVQGYIPSRPLKVGNNIIMLFKTFATWAGLRCCPRNNSDYRYLNRMDRYGIRHQYDRRLLTVIC